jgi:hypothetical protein
MVGKREDAEDRVGAVARDREWQVAPEGGAARVGRKNIERRHRIADGSHDRVGGVPQGIREPGDDRIGESDGRDDPQPVGPLDNDDHRGFDVELRRDHAKQDVQARSKGIRVGKGSSPQNQDLASGLAGHGALLVRKRVCGASVVIDEEPPSRAGNERVDQALTRYLICVANGEL